jgi:hypothetical protein
LRVVFYNLALFFFRNEPPEEEKGEPRVEGAFRPGSIHELQFRKFWEENLGASKWVLETFEFGYKLPFSSETGVYKEENNVSARAKPEEVRRIVGEMIAGGIRLG